MEELVVKVNNFEGPFDLLLNLIEKKKMMISDINISQLIDEYLEVLKLSERENIEIKSDFIIIASELIEIKTLNLLNLDSDKEKETNLKRRLEEHKLFKELTPNLTEEQKILFYNKLAEDYISEKSPNEAITISDLLIALNSSEAKVYGNMYKSYANISLNKLDEAEKFALEAEKLSNNSLESENLLYQIYNSKGDLKKALDKAIILKNATKTQEFYLDVILLAEIAKNTKVVNDTIKELKENKDIKDDVKKNLNILIANGFVNLGYLDGAEDYANKALKVDKNKEANMVLAFVQGSKGNKGLALKYVREAKKDKIEGAEQLEQQILNLK